MKGHNAGNQLHFPPARRLVVEIAVPAPSNYQINYEIPCPPIGNLRRCPLGDDRFGRDPLRECEQRQPDITVHQLDDGSDDDPGRR